jgi:hypothetical protein
MGRKGGEKRGVKGGGGGRVAQRDLVTTELTSKADFEVCCPEIAYMEASKLRFSGFASR